jgi:predicted O-methyltransferase YrrM
MPPHVEGLRTVGVNLIIADEREYLLTAAADSYDVIMSDANHSCAHEYVNEVFRIARIGAMIFFHDTSNPMFPNLRQITGYVRNCGYYHYEFTEKSRPEERTDRGLLFAIKNR